MSAQVREHRERANERLAEGLERFGRGDLDGAIECWRAVLTRFPDDTTARDYLESAGVGVSDQSITPLRGHPPAPVAVIPQPSTPSQPSAAPPQVATAEVVGIAVGLGSLRGDVEALVQAGKYEKALALLHDARRRAPADPSLSRSIRILKSQLRDQYEEDLGDLSRVPAANGPLLAKMGRAHHQVHSLADGIATLEDIVDSAAGSPYLVFRCLHELLKAGCLVLAEQTSPGEPPTAINDLEPEAPAQDFDALFDEAMRFYLRRNYIEAERLLLECLELRPEDRRAQHNLTKIQSKGLP